MTRALWTSALALAVIAAAAVGFAQPTRPAAPPPPSPPPLRITKPGEKEVFIPLRGVTGVPDGNDYNNPGSEFSFQRSRSSPHFVLFWAKEYGENPKANPVASRRFNPDEILKEADRFYTYYVDTLKWVDKEKSFATRYKFLFYVIGGTGGTAFGGSVDNKIGAFWTPATRINRGPYGVVAHELGHSFQALLRADGFITPAGGSIHEMTSQYMLWQVYPEWTTFENYHLNDFMKQTHLAFLHPDNQYHSCYPLEYWSNTHGVEFIGKLWRSGRRGEDIVQIYKRITDTSQEAFNDEMFDACRRFVTWDMPRIEKVNARYANQHTSALKRVDDGWYQVPPERCPQNYGYNAIKLQVPAAGTKVTLDFKGLVGAEGYRSVHPEKAGWRYGFLASKEDGSRVYGDVGSKNEGTLDFTVPAGTRFLWLVVMGAPTEYFPRPSGRGGRGRGAAGSALMAAGDEQWPYRIKLTGAAPDASVLR
jgi:hypothetical protein